MDVITYTLLTNLYVIIYDDFQYTWKPTSAILIFIFFKPISALLILIFSFDHLLFSQSLAEFDNLCSIIEWQMILWNIFEDHSLTLIYVYMNIHSILSHIFWSCFIFSVYMYTIALNILFAPGSYTSHWLMFCCKYDCKSYLMLFYPCWD